MCIPRVYLSDTHVCVAIVKNPVCTLPNYITDAGKLYATGGDANTKHEVHFTGINWSGMENIEGVPHGLATGQSDLVRLCIHKLMYALDI